MKSLNEGSLLWASVPITHPPGASSQGVAPSSAAGAQSRVHLALLFPSSALAPTRAFISAECGKGDFSVGQQSPRDTGPEVRASSSQQLSKYTLTLC